MTFDYPVLLYLAPVIGLGLLVLGWLARRRRIQAADAWSEPIGAMARRNGRLTPVALGVIGLVAGVAVAGPRFGQATVAAETRSLNLVFAIDISRSMLAEDAAPSRLQRAVREARRVLQDARGDRVALLAFAGQSYILTPLTVDEGAVSLQLDALDPDIASEGGTDLTSVLKQGAEILTAASEGGARALVLFTDGEGHDSLSPALAAARELRTSGVTVIVVGQGGITPVRIPLRDPTGRLLEYKTDALGAPVYTQRHDETLRALADAAEGVLVPADIADQASVIWKTLAGLDRKTAASRRIEDSIPRAWILALIAGLALLLHAATRRTAALAALGLAVGLGSASAQRPDRAATRLARGDSTRAGRIYLEEARAAKRADTSWYNAGTVALATGQLDSARTAFAPAQNSLDPDLRFRALYNGGLAALLAARQDSTHRDALLDEAAARFRDALLLDPRSADAKWNLELAQRPKPPEPPSSGGSSPKAPPPPQPSRSDPGLSKSEAEQILSSVERFERAVRAEQLKRRRVARSAADKDW